MRKLAIIADDLTGACDSGVQFARLGYDTTVLFQLDDLSRFPYEVTIIDTDSRSTSPQTAYSRVFQAATELKKHGYDSVFKKVDSTLRGNLGIEIEAVLDVFAGRMAIVAPAFPSMGRLTRNGCHYINGTPVHETEAARDPKCPVLKSDIGELLKLQSSKNIGYLDRQVLAGGADGVSEELETLRKQGIEIAVCDAESDLDLQLIFDGVIRSGIHPVWVGSAGLTKAIQQAYPLRETNHAGRAAYTGDGPVLIVSGSLSDVTAGQIVHLQQRKRIENVTLDPIRIIEGGEWRLSERRRCTNVLREQLLIGKEAILKSDTAREQVNRAQQVGAGKGLTASEVSDLLADELGRITSELLEEGLLHGLILIGGDTAKSVCRNSGVRGITLYHEIDTGIPLGRLQGAGDIPVVTKAGAFGSEDALIKAVAAIKGEVKHV